MNDEDLNRLFEQAKHRNLEFREFGFETRLLARIRQEKADSPGYWAWRLLPVFAGITAACLLVSPLSAPFSPPSNLEDLLPDSSILQTFTPFDL